MTPETEPPPAAAEEQASRGLRWFVVLAALALAVVLIVIVYGYLARPGWIGVSDKKFWDYLELLIVPAALALGAYWLNRAQERERQAQEARREREREAEAEQKERERKATEEARKERELEVENQRAQYAVLQAYLDHMSRLLLDKDRPLRQAKKDDEVRTLAQARTLAALDVLSPERQKRVLRFLHETELIQAPQPDEEPVVSLRFARMKGIKMRRGRLLKGANLTQANMTDADLRGADLTGTQLNDAKLIRAKLTNAILTYADLTDAKGVTNEELHQQAASLEGATMPNGQKYEEWLKDKEDSRRMGR